MLEPFALKSAPEPATSPIPASVTTLLKSLVEIDVGSVDLKVYSNKIVV